MGREIMEQKEIEIKEMLLSLIESYPLIWLISDRDYRDKQKQQNAWEAIFLTLKVRKVLLIIVFAIITKLMHNFHNY